MIGTNLFSKKVNADGNTEYVALADENGYPVLCKGTVVPTAGNYAKGCKFIKTGVATGTNSVYINKGTSTTASFKLVADTTESAGLGGLYVKKTALAVYDFAVDGGVVGAIVLADTGTLPNNAVVTAITYDVLTTCTSATDAGTIALTLPTDGAFSTAIAISDGTTPWDAGVHLSSVITPIAIKTTASRAIGITVAVEAITAGKIVFAVDYYVSQ